MLAAIGNTPLVELNQVSPPGIRLFAKLEGLNPGGSAKDRSSLAMLEAGIHEGMIRPNTVVVESSSGNMGIGLAQACCRLGLRLICVMDSKTTPHNIRLMRAYGAELVVIDQPDSPARELLPARLAKVQELLRTVPNAYWPNQYENSANSRAHRDQTAREIVDELGTFPNAVLSPVSTCGMLGGLLQYFRAQGALTRVCAVDLVGSVVFGGAPAPRIIPGLGSSRESSLVTPSEVHEVIRVTDFDCVVGCRVLASREALVVGGSSGATFVAAFRSALDRFTGGIYVLIFPDRGERYLDTLFDDDWVEQHISPMDRLNDAVKRYCNG